MEKLLANDPQTALKIHLTLCLAFRAALRLEASGEKRSFALEVAQTIRDE